MIVAARVFERQSHRFQNCALQVALLAKQTSSSPREETGSSPEGNDSGPNEPRPWSNRGESSNRVGISLAKLYTGESKFSEQSPSLLRCVYNGDFK